MKQKVIAQKSKNIHVTEHYILEDRQGTGYIYGGGGKILIMSMKCKVPYYGWGQGPWKL